MDHTDDTERALRSPPGGAIVDLTELVALLPRYGPAMNAFLQHHADAIAFCYSCFDRLLLNGYIRALQFGGSIVSFLRQHRAAKLVSPDYLRRLSGDYHRWVEAEAQRDGWEIVTPPPDVRRQDWVEPYDRPLGEQTGVAV